MDHLFPNNTRTIAIVGLSDNPERPSYQVAQYLQSQGFKIIPVNPSLPEVLGEQSYPDLTSIPQDITIDVVDLFRRSDAVMPHVQEAIDRGVKTIWMQEGIENEDAKTYAEEKGATVIMNFCLMKAHQKSSLPS